MMTPEGQVDAGVYPRVDYTQEPWTVAGTVDGCYA